jgi:hypothetical protein
MYTIITKWTPNSNIARYLSFTEIELILANGNTENELPIVAPEKYDAEIYGAWATALEQYRNYFLENLSGMDYLFFNNDQGSVITIQIFDLEETHTAVMSQSFYNNFVSSRQAFATLIDVNFEIKKTSEEIAAVDSYETAEEFFNVL